MCHEWHNFHHSVKLMTSTFKYEYMHGFIYHQTCLHELDITYIILALSLPGKWGMTFHSYGHGHKMQGPPCTSAKAFASFPFPWALQMHPPGHNNSQRNTQGHDEQQRLTMVVSVYPPKQGNVQWICTVPFPPSNHAQYQQYRSETCHSLWSTLRIHRLYLRIGQNSLK